MSRPVVSIIGVGLIGGSFGMALKKRGLAGEVIGVGRNPGRLERAVELGALDSWTTDVQEGVSRADLVYVSTPVGMVVDFVKQAAAAVKPGCVITDAGSTKSEICAGAEKAVPEGVHFVGAHPMAGSETAGVEHADPDLFVGAAYVLTPTEKTDAGALALVRSLAEGIGSRIVVIDPAGHDRCVAVISHLPHLMAAALVALAERESKSNPQMLEMLAGSFRDMTRVASSSPVLWRDICISNSGAVVQAVRNFESIMKDAASFVESGNGEGFEEWFAAAKEVRDSLYLVNGEQGE